MYHTLHTYTYPNGCTDEFVSAFMSAFMSTFVSTAPQALQCLQSFLITSCLSRSETNPLSQRCVVTDATQAQLPKNASSTFPRPRGALLPPSQAAEVQATMCIVWVVLFVPRLVRPHVLFVPTYCSSDVLQQVVMRTEITQLKIVTLIIKPKFLTRLLTTQAP